MSEFLQSRVVDIKISINNKLSEIEDLQGEIRELKNELKFIDPICRHQNIIKIQIGYVQQMKCKDCYLILQTGTSLFDRYSADEKYPLCN